MCDKCTEFDEKIAHYRRICRYVPDQLTKDRLEQLLAEMSAQKTARII